MLRINRYMIRQILTVTMAATVVLCLAVLLAQSIRLVDLIVNRGLPFGEFAYMALLMTPRFVAYVMPIAMFGAVLFTFNRMIGDSELIVLRAAGLSSATLARPGLAAGLLVSLICYLMTLYLMPLSAQEFRLKLEENRSQWGSALLHEGRFTTVGKDVTLFVHRRDGRELLGVMYHNNEDKAAPYTVLAERGAIIDTPEGPRILVSSGSRQAFADGKLHMLEFDESTIDLTVSRSTDSRYWIQPNERFLGDLLAPGTVDREDIAYRDQLIAEGHGRLVLPLLPLTYATLALTFMLRVGFSRAGNGGAILIAATLMTLLLAGHLTIVNAMAKLPVLIPLLYANATLPALLCLFILHRPRRWRMRPAPAAS